MDMTSAISIEVVYTRWQYVVKVDGSVIAKVTFRIDQDENNCSMWDLWVDPKSRRQALGSLLVMACIAAGKRQHRHRLWLSVEAENEPAVALYTKLGFLRYGQETDKQDKVHLLMRYDLSVEN